MTRARVLLLVSCLIAAADARAHDEHLPRAWVEPGRDTWVKSPVDLRVSFFDVDPVSMRHVQPGSLRVLIDDIDVTAVLLALAAQPGGFEIKDAGHTAVLRARVPFAAGTHRVLVSYRLLSGHEQRFEQAFRVYDPIDVLRDLGIVGRKQDNSVGPLQVEVPSRPIQAPPVWLTPQDLGFVNTASADLRVEWARGGAGMQLGALKVLLDNQDVTAKFTVGRDSAVWSGAPLANGKRTLVAQVADHAGNLRVATSTFIVYDGSKRKPWFYSPTNQTHPFAHTHHQYQNYGSGSSGAYFHHGVDINRPSGSRIYCVEGGNITAFWWYGQQPYYFEIEITDSDGFRYQYHHIDYPQIPASIVQIAQNKGFVAQGTDIGANVYWPSSAYGQRFHHIHLNVIAPDGRYMNPMNLLLKLQDTVNPTVFAVYLTQNGSETILNPNGVSDVTVGGKLDFVAQAEDLVQNQPYQLTVYRMTWELEELTGSKTHHVPETELWRFDYLPDGANRYGNVFDIFRYRLLNGASYLYTRGDYNQRIFYYTLTNRVDPTTVSETAGFWDSAAQGIDGPLFPNGQYRLTVRAYDIAGNSGSRAITFYVKN